MPAVLAACFRLLQIAHRENQTKTEIRVETDWQRKHAGRLSLE